MTNRKYDKSVNFMVFTQWSTAALYQQLNRSVFAFHELFNRDVQIDCSQIALQLLFDTYAYHNTTKAIRHELISQNNLRKQKVTLQMLQSSKTSQLYHEAAF